MKKNDQVLWLSLMILSRFILNLFFAPYLFFFVLRASELIAMRKVSGLEVLVFSHVIYEVAIWIVLDTALLESS